MTTTASTVTQEHAEQVLHAVAAWMGKRGMGQWRHTADGSACTDVLRCHYADGCAWQGRERTHTYDPVAPTGEDAAYAGDGPMLRMEWDWPGQATPTIILEGGPDDWAIACSFAVQDTLTAAGVPVWVEPYAGYALCIYPNSSL